MAPRPYATRRLRLLFHSGKLFYLNYAVTLCWWLLWQRADILLSNDMDTLLPNWMVARLRRKVLVYDSHEYWTEVPELRRGLVRAVWLRLEKWLFPRVDAAMTVNASIARIYEQKYGLPVQVVRNLPQLINWEDVPPRKARQVIYQGALNVGRGIEMLIDAMEYLPEYQLVIVGYGNVDRALREQAASRAWAGRIDFKGFLAPESLRPVTAASSLGVSLEEDLGESYHLASSNKLFDYIQAGVPVIVSDLPEMAAVVRKHGVGEVLTAYGENSPQRLAERIHERCGGSWINSRAMPRIASKRPKC
ncbi:MAG: glycosyltransferase [Bacteroidia bacterium]